MDSSYSSSSSPAESKVEPRVWWSESLKGWSYIMYLSIVQKFQSRHLQNPLPLPPLNDVTCIVTGSTSGIGLEIARQLAFSGAHVVMAVRNKSAASDLIRKWRGERRHGTGRLNIEVMGLNLLSLNSVVKFAKAWNKSSPKPLQVLINNAGIFSAGEPQKFTKDGYETHMQVNHLAPALLSVLLLPSLVRGSPSRIVNVNSTAHYMGFVDTSDMNLTSGKHKYSTSSAYSCSKLAKVMFSSFLQYSLPPKARISVVCVSPGNVYTNMIRNVPRFVQDISYFLSSGMVFSPQEGARSALYAATDPQIVNYCKRSKNDREWRTCAYISHDCYPTSAAKEAHSKASAKKVWEKTLDMIGLPPDGVEKLVQGKEVVCRYEDRFQKMKLCN